MNTKSKRVGEILETKNYQMFKSHKMNRTINEPHVKSLYNDMIVNGWLNGSIVTINEKGETIDGHHRLIAAEKANVPVHYRVVSKANFKTIRAMNSKSRNWNIIDHLEGYVKEGNQNYILLHRFMKNFPTFKPTECTMLVKNSTNSAQRGEFESGEFKVKDMKIAYQWGHHIMLMKPYFENGYNKSIFVRSMVRVLQNPEFVFEEFLHKVKLRPSMIHMCGTVDQYLEMIEGIYNYKRNNSDKLNLRF